MNGSAAPSTEKSLLREGITAIETGDFDTARAKLFSITEENPKNAEAWLWLSKIATGNGAKLAYLRKAYESDPRRPETQRAFTEFVVRDIAPLAKTDQRAEARKTLLSIVDLYPECEPAWLCLAFLEEKVSDKRHCLANVLLWNPEHKTAREWLESLGPEQPEAQTVANRANEAALPSDLDIFDGYGTFDLSPVIVAETPSSQPKAVIAAPVIPPKPVEKPAPAIPNKPVEKPAPVAAVQTKPAVVETPHVPMAPPPEVNRAGGGSKGILFGAAAAAVIVLLGGALFFLKPGPTPKTPTVTSDSPAVQPQSPATTTPAVSETPNPPPPAPTPTVAKSAEPAEPKKTPPPVEKKTPPTAVVGKAAPAATPKKTPAKGDREDGALIRAH